MQKFCIKVKVMLIVLHNKDGGVKLFKLFGLFSIVFVPFLVAGTFEHFERFQESAFVKYSDAEDIVFKKYLDVEFKEFVLQGKLHRYLKNKPSRLPVTQFINTTSVGPRVDMQLTKLKQVNFPAPFSLKDKEFVINFFGLSFGFNIDSKIKDAKFYPQTQIGIGNFFEQIASSEYSYLVVDIQLFIKKYKLNDWGVILLVKKIVEKVFKQKNEADIFRWFLLSKLGYDVHLTLAKKHIILFFATEQKIYDRTFFIFNKKRYYNLDDTLTIKEISSVYSYKHIYKNGVKAFDFSLYQLPMLPQKIEQKELFFRELREQYRISFQYNQNLIDFLATYPQVDEKVYFKAPLDPITQETLFRSLQHYVDTKRASRAITFLLHFTQNSFLYKVDQQQFGYEKMMFAQETLVYSSSDCEDRSVLFAYLITKILHLSIVGVVYPDHFSTALYIPLNGDKIDVNGREFVLSDPSYRNANIGYELSKYKGQKPTRIVVLKKSKENI